MDHQTLELLSAVLIGVGLSAACGFRVFIPLLGAGIASHFGYMNLSPEFSWLGSTPALIALSLATVIEIGAYSVPLIDHIMDAITTPAAVIAGALLMASQLGEVSPLLQWSLAIIAGGGTAGLVQSGSVLARGNSTLLTGGFGNIAFALLEFCGAVVMTLMALFVPFLAVLCLVVGLTLMIRFARRCWLGKSRIIEPVPPS